MGGIRKSGTSLFEDDVEGAAFEMRRVVRKWWSNTKRGLRDLVSPSNALQEALRGAGEEKLAKEAWALLHDQTQAVGSIPDQWDAFLDELPRKISRSGSNQMGGQSLRKRIIRLAYERPDLRADLLPLIGTVRKRATAPRLRDFDRGVQRWADDNGVIAQAAVLSGLVSDMRDAKRLEKVIEGLESDVVKSAVADQIEDYMTEILEEVEVEYELDSATETFEGEIWVEYEPRRGRTGPMWNEDETVRYEIEYPAGVYGSKTVTGTVSTKPLISMIAQTLKRKGFPLDQVGLRYLTSKVLDLEAFCDEEVGDEVSERLTGMGVTVLNGPEIEEAFAEASETYWRGSEEGIEAAEWKGIDDTPDVPELNVVDEVYDFEWTRGATYKVEVAFGAS